MFPVSHNHGRLIGSFEPLSRWRFGREAFPAVSEKQYEGGVVKKVLRPAKKRPLVSYLESSFRVSERRACVILGFGRSGHRYQGKKDEQALLRMKTKEIAAVRVRYGYKRIHVLSRREGWEINVKRVYRLYCEEGLNLRAKRPKRRVSAAHRMQRQEARASMNAGVWILSRMPCLTDRDFGP